MEFLHCNVRIRSELCLEEVGDVISERVLGGVRLEGREEYIRDEVPAIYNLTPVLGLRFILEGEPDEEGYFLVGGSWRLGREFSTEQIKAGLHDISGLVVRLLNGVEGIQAFPNKE